MAISGDMAKVRVMAEPLGRDCPVLVPCGQGHGRADSRGVHLPVRRQVCVVPVRAAASRRPYLRLRPAGNGQQQGVPIAEDFELDRCVNELRPRPALAEVA